MAELCEATGADVTAARRRDRPRRPDRPQVPQRRARLRRRLPAQGHPGVHGPGRRAGRRPGADLPAGGRRHQHAPPHPDGRPGPRGVRRLARSASRIAVLGAAFKPDSDDIRDSPALNVAAQLQLQGAVVMVTDPEALENAARTWPDLHFAATAEEAADGAELVLLLTEWKQYRDLDPARPSVNRATAARARRPQRLDPRPGARPAGVTARSAVPWSKAANDDGTFRSDEELRELYTSAGVDLGTDTIAYCRIGGAFGAHLVRAARAARPAECEELRRLLDRIRFTLVDRFSRRGGSERIASRAGSPGAIARARPPVQRSR